MFVSTKIMSQSESSGVCFSSGRGFGFGRDGTRASFRPGTQRAVKYPQKSVMVTLFLMLENTGGKGVVHRRKFVLRGALGQVGCAEGAVR